MTFLHVIGRAPFSGWTLGRPWFRPLAGPALLLATILAVPAAELRIETAIRAGDQDRPLQTPGAHRGTRNGDFYAVYYGGEGEYAVDTGVFGSRLKKGSRKWTPPTRIAHDPFRSLGNGVIWQAPDGLVWLFYVVRYGETWSTSRVQAKVSRDNAQTWSDAFPLVSDEGMMVCNRPIVLHNGDYLLPLYHETGHDTEFTAPDSSGLFLRYDVKKKKWKQTGRIRSATGTSSRCRWKCATTFSSPTSGGAAILNPRPTAGRSAPSRTTAAGPGAKASTRHSRTPTAAVDFIKLRSGNLLLVFNDSMNDRTPADRRAFSGQ